MRAIEESLPSSLTAVKFEKLNAFTGKEEIRAIFYYVDPFKILFIVRSVKSFFQPISIKSIPWIPFAELMKNDARMHKPSREINWLWPWMIPSPRPLAGSDEFDRAFPDVIHVESIHARGYIRKRRAARFFGRSDGRKSLRR